VYGRGMYENMTAFWPTADQDPEAPDYVLEWARIWKVMPKIVFSTTLEKVEWNSRLVRGNVAEEIARLKAQPGKDLALGGAKLAASFMKLGLIDEYQLFVQPVVLGRGAPMFHLMDKPVNLRLLETLTFTSGVVYQRYQAKTGS
jgi:dihydrofolate reductase